VQSGNAVREQVQVQHVTDGDTVVLSDSRRVRLIGINAPEMKRNIERSMHPQATAARDLINAEIRANPSVQLVIGNEAEDQYGRTLAHVLLATGENLATILLARGLAAATAVSPNTRCASYYQRIEAAARVQLRGVWVVAVKQHRKEWILRLKGGAEIMATPELMPASNWQQLNQQTVEVRGWFSRHNGKTRVRLHHPSNLSVSP